MIKFRSCKICGLHCESTRLELKSMTEYGCDYCGFYLISDLFGLDPSEGNIRAMMYYCLLHMNFNNKTICFVNKVPVAQDDTCGFLYIDREALLRMYPTTISEKVDMVMLNLGKRIKTWGDTCRVELAESSYRTAKQLHYYGVIFICANPLLKIYSDTDINYIQPLLKEVRGSVTVLEEYGYLKTETSSDYYDAFTFTVDGWKHLGNLQAKSKELPQAFIAMWFDKEKRMDGARENIKKAIKDCGYTPILIDEKEHNNQIVPEILYEIRRSRFIVADLSGHRNGVYYEAGYAQGLGKEAILTCKESDFKERHFDVAQISTIVWKDEEDLYKKLLKRIEVTVGKRIGID